MQWLRRAARRVYQRLLGSPFRYSFRFKMLQGLFTYSAREQMVRTAIEFARSNQVPGDYLEFGVFKGATFAAAHHFAQQRELPEMRFYAFDSFQGLPESKGLDRYEEGDAQFSQGQFGFARDDFLDNLRARRVDLDKVELVEGWFEQTLTAETRARLPIQRAAVIWVDCDLYESTVPVLEFVTDYVQDGTVMVFDDWFCFRGDPDRGEQRALREWLEKHPDIQAMPFHVVSWHGMSFILRRQR